MYCDGICKKRNDYSSANCNKYGLNDSNKRVLKLMQNAPNAIIDGAVLLNVFQEQYN
jgi:hypothetical protein